MSTGMGYEAAGTRRWAAWLTVACLALASPGLGPAGSAGAADSPQPLRLGIQPYADAATILQQYTHLARYLQRQGYAVEVQTAPDSYKFLMRTLEGRYDLVLMPPHFLTLARQDAGYVPLLRLGEEVVPTVFVRANSPLQRLGDLRGHTVSVPGELSYIALSLEIALRGAGLEPGRDLILEDGLTHPNVLLELNAGQTEAAATVPLMVELMQARLGNGVRELAQVGAPMSLAYGVRGDLGPDRIEMLRELLFAFPESPEGQAFSNPAAPLRHRPVNPDDYRADAPVVQELRRYLARMKGLR